MSIVSIPVPKYVLEELATILDGAAAYINEIIAAAAVPPAPGGASALDAHQRMKIVAAAAAQLGKPYKWGGNEPETGFDCSGLVHYAYTLGTGRSPGRTTAELYKMLGPAAADIRPADLVFFTHPGSAAPGHVGIIEDPETCTMLHASSSQGVQRISYKTNPYWAARFTSAGPVLLP